MATDYDGQGKGHDPLCPYGPHRAPTVAPCRTCLVINKVRADEREQAAQRVAGLITDGNTQWDQAINHAINAAKGDTP